MCKSNLHCRRAFRCTALGLLFALIALSPSQVFGDPPESVKRAISYLATEVPSWHRENGCYSCHNNGDAIRALVAAGNHGLLRDRKPLDNTLEFLCSPAKWDANGPDGPFKDAKLARIQFAAALADATTSGLIGNPEPLHSAAKLLAELQRTDGSWPADAEGTLGSPITYGQPLASAMAIRTLFAASAKDFATHIESGQRWFVNREPRGILDAAATLLALSDTDGQACRLRRTQSIKLISTGESDGGGWGPFVNSPPEVFDTAVVILALNAEILKHPEQCKLAAPIDRGRDYLMARQQADGSWLATTRPPGVDSYAQQISTTGWALQALLATAAKISEKTTTVTSKECK